MNFLKHKKIIIAFLVVLVLLNGIVSFTRKRNDTRNLDVALTKNTEPEVEKLELTHSQFPEFKVVLDVELAKTIEQQQTGLMNRKEMDKDKGMLFIFNEEVKRSFWMKDTYIPLDIIYFDKDMKFVSVSRNTEPCLNKGFDCPSYPSTGKAMYVLETNAERVEEKYLSQGLGFELRM